MSDAAAEAPVEVELHGDVKTFVVGSAWDDDLVGQGTGAFRLRGTLDSRYLDFVVHHEVVAITGPSTASTGVGLTAPELVDLTWQTAADDSLLVRGRTDRLVATLHVPHLDVAIGRQPISFGSGLFFQPLDLVNPFLPATVDSEYKPGVDAIRADVYAGTSGQITVVAAAAGDVAEGEAVFAATGRGTVGVTDLQGFVGEVHGDEVVGASIVTAVGPVGVHADAAFTLPADADLEDPFLRAVIGADGRPHAKVFVAAELYLQTFGGKDATEYLGVWTLPRFARGEVWSAGQLYAAASASYELTPLVAVQGAAITNLRDPSALVFGSVAWSVSDDSSVAAGLIAGVGEGADGLLPQSEYGSVPVSGYLQLRAYF